MISPLRIGILGAAGITPTSLVAPAATAGDVELVAIAARNREKAATFAEKWSIPTVAGTYEELVTRDDIDAVYIALPNSEHARWSTAAIQAGKHVLVEKPFASNEVEAREVAELAAASDLIVMEAYHYRYHPLIPQLQKMIADGVIGDLTHVEAIFDITMPDTSNIRYNFDLAGGSTMDLGCYSLHFARAIIGGDPIVVGARARAATTDARIDEALTAELRFPNDVTATISSSLLEPVERQSALIAGSRGSISVEGFVKPQEGNTITITVDGVSTVSEAPAAPTTYQCQLAAFVDAVRTGAAPLTDAQDAVAMMHLIDGVYRAAGLTPRGLLG